MFIKLYHHSQYQILPIVADKLHIDCLVTCCNPAVKSIVNAWITENGNPVIQDVFYRDLFFVQSGEGKQWIDSYKADHHFLDEVCGWQKLIYNSGIENALEYGFFNKRLYRHRFQLSYQEQEFLNSLPSKYIVIHPSGGLQTIDGLTREEYRDLIELLLAEQNDTMFITIGASHSRDWTNIEKRGNITKESQFELKHPRFLDMTNKTSGALCTNIVENASGFIGSHSAWMNYFWCISDKPVICILSNKTDWGTAENYVKTNGCRWGFALPQTKVIPVIEDKSKSDIYKEVIKGL